MVFLLPRCGREADRQAQPALRASLVARALAFPLPLVLVMSVFVVEISIVCVLVANRHSGFLNRLKFRAVSLIARSFCSIGGSVLKHTHTSGLIIQERGNSKAHITTVVKAWVYSMNMLRVTETGSIIEIFLISLGTHFHLFS